MGRAENGTMKQRMSRHLLMVLINLCRMWPEALKPVFHGATIPDPVAAVLATPLSVANAACQRSLFLIPSFPPLVIVRVPNGKSSWRHAQRVMGPNICYTNSLAQAKWSSHTNSLIPMYSSTSFFFANFDSTESTSVFPSKPFLCPSMRRVLMVNYLKNASYILYIVSYITNDE